MDKILKKLNSKGGKHNQSPQYVSLFCRRTSDVLVQIPTETDLCMAWDIHKNMTGLN